LRAEAQRQLKESGQSERARVFRTSDCALRHITSDTSIPIDREVRHRPARRRAEEGAGCAASGFSPFRMAFHRGWKEMFFRPR
jgi:hypothetical protein